MVRRMLVQPIKKRVFITGAASGLGRALADRYARAGWRVCLADVNDQGGSEALTALRAAGHEAEFLHCDVRHDADVQAAADWLQEHWGGVDLVYNNAGVAAAGPAADLALEDWQWILDINVLGVVRGCKTFVPLFKQQGHGHVVNIASMAGLVHPPRMASYCAAKAAVVALSESLYFELAPANIAVSVVCPSFFRSPLIDGGRFADAQTKGEAQRFFAQATHSAETIAERVFRGVTRRDFQILTDAEGRAALGLKRWAPFWLYRKVLARHLNRVASGHPAS